MYSDVAIKVDNLGKCFHIYDQPRDRLKQSLLPRLQKVSGYPIKKYHREFWALKNISFEIRKGETVGIIGKNGSGKSSLLQLICGTLSPTEGNIHTCGRIAALLELGSGFNPEFSGRENVYLYASILGLSPEQIDDKYEDILSFAEIGEFIDQPIKTYSSGMVVRLAFSVAINIEPQILIVDEALSVGDELFQRKCFSRIETIREMGATILFVSHSAGTIVELCDRAVLLDAGEMLASGSPKKIVGRYQKLLYAPVEKRQSIREQILVAYGQNDLSEDDSGCELQEEDGEGVAPDQEQQESFDPFLKPSSSIEYESHGAFIEKPSITTLSGKKVNNLVRGRTYRYVYSVRFAKRASNVSFGMLIKTTSGVELGGSATAKSPGSSLTVEAATDYTIDFQFRCALNPGVYFLNAGVIGEINGSQTYLHRIIDIAMFRVLPDNQSLATGVVDFGCKPTIMLSKKSV